MSVEWFWKRDDIYHEPDGNCPYLEWCGKERCEEDPEECREWEIHFDAEVSADEDQLDSD